MVGRWWRECIIAFILTFPSMARTNTAIAAIPPMPCIPSQEFTRPSGAADTSIGNAIGATTGTATSTSTATGVGTITGTVTSAITSTSTNTNTFTFCTNTCLTPAPALASSV
ncbi:uncharacterized protein LOC132185847 [Corylus avellana]|uniref:uncharacterized protein LOC132185847 n=1 Tax=Corylus avellana TaxID=13451 RepID=UPI00286D195A|nr:uncharacterized protein LOC132185847 [Corylus avellana]